MKYLIFYFASLSSVINEVRFVERINLNLLREIIQVFSSSLLIVTQEHIHVWVCINKMLVSNKPTDNSI